MNGDDNWQFINLMSQFKGMDSLSDQLNFILVLLYSLDGETQTLFEPEIKKFEDFTLDIDFMRKVKHRDSLVKNYASEYFGRDYTEDDPFLFNPDLEKQINEISLEIKSVLGRVLKTMAREEIVIDDET